MTRPAAEGPWTAAWSRPVEASDRLLLALTRDFVFLAGPGTPIVARASATGEVAWRHPIESWSALAGTETFVLGVSGDHAYALDAATGRTRWITQTTGANTRLYVSGQRLLMVSDTDVLLRDIETGTGLWHGGLTSPPAATPPAFDTGVVAIAQQDGTVVLFDLATGAMRWRRQLTSTPVALAARAPMLYAGLPDGSFCALGMRDGSDQWCFPLRVPMSGAPAITDDVVRVALLDNSLRTFDRSNGAMRQQQSLGQRPATALWSTNAHVIAGLTTGEFVVVDRDTSRTVARLPVPGATSSHLLQAAGISPAGGTLAGLTIAPGGVLRLSAFRMTAATALPMTTDLPPARRMPLVAPPPAPPQPAAPSAPASPAPPRTSRPVPRPFPLPE